MTQDIKKTQNMEFMKPNGVEDSIDSFSNGSGVFRTHHLGRYFSASSSYPGLSPKIPWLRVLYHHRTTQPVTGPNICSACLRSRANLLTLGPSLAHVLGYWKIVGKRHETNTNYFGNFRWLHNLHNP